MKIYIDKTVSWDRLGISFKQAQPFQKMNNQRAMFHILFFLGLLILSALSVIFFALQGWWTLFALALYVHGGLMPFCDSAIHELTHNAMFTKKSYNLFFARLFSLLYWRLNHAFFSISHSKYHTYLQMQVSDGEIMPPALFTKKQFLIGLSPITLLSFVRASLKLLSLQLIIFLRASKFTPWQEHLLQTAQTKVVHEIYQWAYITLLFHLAILVVAVITGFWLLPLVTTLSPFYGVRWYYLLIEVTQHAGMDYDNNRFSEVCRSIRLDPFSSFLYFHMEHHVEHHMFSSIPSYRLKEFRKAFEDKFPQRFSLIQEIPQIFKASKELEQKIRLHKV